MVKQEMARVNIDILGISELKWTGMGEFNSDDHYIRRRQMAPHSSTVAQKIPWMEEPGRLQSMGSLRAGHFTFTFHFHALEKEMATHCSVLAWYYSVEYNYSHLTMHIITDAYSLLGCWNIEGISVINTDLI